MNESARREDWERRFAAAVQGYRVAQFELGDLIVEGRALFGSRSANDYKAVYDIAERSGIKRVSLKRFAWVARAIPREYRRIDQLSFGHHEVVAPLFNGGPDDVQRGIAALDRAVVENWTYIRLRNELGRAPRLESGAAEERIRAARVQPSRPRRARVGVVPDWQARYDELAALCRQLLDCPAHEAERQSEVLEQIAALVDPGQTSSRTVLLSAGNHFIDYSPLARAVS